MKKLVTIHFTITYFNQYFSAFVLFCNKLLSLSNAKIDKNEDNERTTFKISDLIKNIEQKYLDSSMSKTSCAEDLVTNYESRNSSKISFMPQQIKTKDIRRVRDVSLDHDISKAITLSKTNRETFQSPSERSKLRLNRLNSSISNENQLTIKSQSEYNRIPSNGVVKPTK